MRLGRLELNKTAMKVWKWQVEMNSSNDYTYEEIADGLT